MRQQWDSAREDISEEGHESEGCKGILYILYLTVTLIISKLKRSKKQCTIVLRDSSERRNDVLVRARRETCTRNFYDGGAGTLAHIKLCVQPQTIFP